MTRNPIEPIRLLFTKVGQQKSNQPLLTCWAKVLGVSPEDWRIFDRLALIGDGLERASQILENSEVPQPSRTMGLNILYDLRPLLVVTHFQNALSSFNENVNIHKLNSLVAIGHLLEHERCDTGISDDELTRLESLVEEMDNLLGAPGLSPELAKMLRPHLSFMQWAIKNYEIIGIEGLTRAYAIASLGISSISVEEVPQGEWKNTLGVVWHRIKEVIFTTRAAAQTGRLTLETMQEVRQLLDLTQQ